jgi:hypothetical protein
MDYGSTYPNIEVFRLVFERIRAHRMRYYQHLRPGKAETRVIEFLECMGTATWDAGEPIFDIRLDMRFKNYGDGTLSALMTDVKKYLKLACDELNVGRVMEVGKIRGTARFRVRWAKTQDITAVPHRDIGAFERIVVIGNLRAGGLHANVMRGIHSMSNELGIDLDDRMRRGWFDKRKIDQEPNPLSVIVREGKLNPDVDSILVRNSDPFMLRGNIDLLRREGFHVVTTGFATGTIRQDNALAGAMLANLCIDDQRRYNNDQMPIGSNCIIVMHQYPDFTDNEMIMAMQDSFRSTILHMSKFKIINFHPPLSYRDARFEEILNHYHKFLRRICKNHDGLELAAILVPDETFANAALHAVSTRHHHKTCRVYGQRLVRNMLEACSSLDSPFHGTCGSEPYYFGRYAARAASCRATSPLPEVPPVLITKADALDHDMVSADRIQAVHHGFDVQCNGERYAWYPWMKSRCPRSYGPDKLIAIQERGRFILY